MQSDRLAISDYDVILIALGGEWYIDLARAKSEATINKFVISLKQ